MWVTTSINAGNFKTLIIYKSAQNSWATSTLEDVEFKQEHCSYFGPEVVNTSEHEKTKINTN